MPRNPDTPELSESRGATANVTDTDVHMAQRKRDDCHNCWKQHRQELDRLERLIAKPRLVRACEALQFVRQLADNSTTRFLGWVVVAFVGFLIPFVFSVWLSPRAILFAGVIVGGVMSILASTIILAIPSDALLQRRVDAYRKFRDAYQSKADEIVAFEFNARRQWLESERAFKELCRIRYAPLNRLKVEAKYLRADVFEQAVKSALEAIGFKVDHVGRVGDYGVDLVAKSGAVRIAVQVKGKSAGKVGSQPVVSVVGAKNEYQCTHTIVIANVGFTKRAKAFAQRNGCYLVSLPDDHDCFVSTMKRHTNMG